MIPPQLYWLTERDQAGAMIQWEPVRILNNNAAASVYLPAYVVPKDKVYCLEAINFIAKGGGAQTVSRVEVYVENPEDTLYYDLIGGANIAAISQVAYDRTYNGLLIPPEWHIDAEATFNAGVAANYIELYLFGYLLPVGTVQR